MDSQWKTFKQRLILKIPALYFHNKNDVINEEKLDLVVAGGEEAYSQHATSDETHLNTN